MPAKRISLLLSLCLCLWMSATEASLVAGRVVEAETGTGLSGVSVLLRAPNGQLTGSVVSDFRGNFLLANVPDGDYLLYTVNDQGLVDEAFPDVPCGLRCEFLDEPLITVTSQRPLRGLLIDLEAGLTISGRVVDALNGQGIAATAVAVNLGDFQETPAATDDQGHYRIGPLDPGSYRVFVDADRHVNEVWRNTICFRHCVFHDGDTIDLTAGSSVTQIDFQLDRGQVVRGRVDAETDPANGFVQLLLYTSRSQVAGGTTVSAGSDVPWEIAGIPDGQYTLRAFAPFGLVSEVYDSMPCVDCFIDPGTPIIVDGADVVGLHLTLEEARTISGRMFDADTLDGVRGVVTIEGADSAVVARKDVNANGGFSISGLPEGRYLIFGEPVDDHLAIVFPDVACIRTHLCDRTAAELIEVLGEDRSGVELPVDNGFPISGTLRTTHGDPVRGSVDVFDESGRRVDHAFADPEWSSVTLTPGRYYLEANSFEPIAAPQVFDGRDCPEYLCDPLSGDPVEIADQSVPEIDLILDQGAMIVGTVRDGDSGEAIAGLSPLLLRSDGAPVQLPTVDNGTFQFAGVPPGEYAMVIRSPEHVDVLVGATTCTLPCGVDDITLFQLDAGDQWNLDTLLQTGGRIEGQLLRARSGDPVLNSSVIVYRADGIEVGQARVEQGRYRYAGLEPGDYRVRTGFAGPFRAELHDDIPCSPGCEVDTGVAVQVRTGESTVVDFSLEIGRTVSGSVRTADTGLPIDGTVHLRGPINDGRAVQTDDGQFIFRGITDGEYALFFRPEFGRGAGYSGISLDGRPCQSDCELVVTPALIVDGENIADLELSAPRIQSIRGTVRYQGNDAPLTGLVFLYAEDGRLYASSGAESRGFLFAQLPPGRYRVATQLAENGLVDQVFGGGECLPECDVLGGSVIVVEDQPVDGIDFVVRRPEDPPLRD